MQTEFNFGNYESNTGGLSLETFISILGTYSIIVSIASILYIVEIWLVFKKCGKKGWYSLIPFLNTWTLFEISGLPGWLSLVPVANIIGLLVVYFKLPKRFGKGIGFGFGMLFLPYIFMGILAFGKNSTADNNQEANGINTVNPVMDVPGEIAVKDDNQNNEVPDLLAPPSENEVIQSQNNIANNTVEEEVLSGLDAPIEEASPSSDIMNDVVMPQIPEEENNTNNNDFNSAFGGNTPAFGPTADNNIQSNNVETLEVTMVSPEPLINDSNIAPSNVQNTNTNTPVITTPTTESVLPEMEIPSTPIVEQAQPSMPLNNEMEPFSNNESIDALESTFEIPKIPNEMINENITSTKKCNSCGTENPYVNKTCITCGANLE